MNVFILQNYLDYKKQKVVFIEKPLPKLKYSIHQQNHWAHKISLKASAMYGWDKISTRYILQFLIPKLCKDKILLLF